MKLKDLGRTREGNIDKEKEKIWEKGKKREEGGATREREK